MMKWSFKKSFSSGLHYSKSRPQLTPSVVHQNGLTFPMWTLFGGRVRGLASRPPLLVDVLAAADVVVLGVQRDVVRVDRLFLSSLLAHTQLLFPLLSFPLSYSSPSFSSSFSCLSSQAARRDKNIPLLKKWYNIEVIHHIQCDHKY